MTADKNKRKDNSKILVIGKVPPPVGGVSVHVHRLLQSFSDRDILVFYNLSNFTTGSFCKQFFKYKTIHLHTSNPLFRLFLAIISFIAGKKLIITYHGNLGRFGLAYNIFDLASIVLAAKPIMLNGNSYNKAKKYNRSAEKISAFIPPAGTKGLPPDIMNAVLRIRETGKRVYCTNAYDLSFDKNGNEIYGISELLQVFSEFDTGKLFVSDPSGNYRCFIENKFGHLSGIPLWITEPHDFFELIRCSDGFIRNTTTDGDSLSVMEALYLGVPVFATGVVDRPPGCILYKSTDDLVGHISAVRREWTRNEFITESAIERLGSLYSYFLSLNLNEANSSITENGQD